MKGHEDMGKHVTWTGEAGPKERSLGFKIEKLTLRGHGKKTGDLRRMEG